MARYILLLFIYFLVARSQAQEVKLDTLNHLLAPLDTFRIPSISVFGNDTLKKIVSKADSLVALTSAPQEQIQKTEERLNSFHQNLQHKLDSLEKVPQPDTVLIGKIARLKSKADSLRNSLTALPGKLIGKDQTLTKIQTEIDSVIGKLQNPINEKLLLFQQNGAENLSSINVPGLSTELLPGADLPSVNIPTSSLPNVNLPQADLTSTDLSLPDIKQPSLDNIEGVGDYSQKLNDVTQQVSEYENDIRNLSTGKIDQLKTAPESLEKEVANHDQLEGIENELAEADKLKRYYDPEVAKEEALNKAKEGAVNHFAGHEEELKAAMEKLSALKAKFPNPEGAIDLFAKRQRFMKGKPFAERLLPGLTFQFQKQQSFWLDLNPHVGFKISHRFIAGLGWNERMCYDFDDMEWDNANHVYGIRSFLHFKLKENYTLKGEIENMNAPLHATRLMTSEITGRTWVWSFFGGVKRDFRFSNTLKGNVQMLFNVYNPEKRSPYTNRFNVRMGFEFAGLKKK